MPGHDKSKIVGWNASDLDEFVCGICQDVLNKPVVTQCCRQSYCEDCIEEWLKVHDKCPNDRKPLTIEVVSEVPRLVINIIDKMQIRCDNSDRGCPEVTTIGTKDDHYKICLYNKCKTCGCDRMSNEHNCVAYLIQKNLTLVEKNNDVTEEKETMRKNLSSVIQGLIKEKSQLIERITILEKDLKRIKKELEQAKRSRSNSESRISHLNKQVPTSINQVNISKTF